MLSYCIHLNNELISLAKNRVKINQQIIKIFDELVDEYLHESNNGNDNGSDNQIKVQTSSRNFDNNNEDSLIQNFLASPCSCKKSCFDHLSFDEIAKARFEDKVFAPQKLYPRKQFRSLIFPEKNVFMLSQLSIFIRNSDKSHSARQEKLRVRQKFDYHVSIDRSVCFDIFLFYHGETIERLKRLQKQKLENAFSNKVHGNSGRSPVHACSQQDKDDIKIFVVYSAAAHGMPDPGRDLRHGKGRLRILLPSVLNYTSVHRAYEPSFAKPRQACCRLWFFYSILEKVLSTHCI
jgi:hypothetical protein